MPTSFCMAHWRKSFLFCLSFFFVAFGQPSWLWWAGVVASSIGYALFWLGALEIESKKAQFWVATAWFGAVQLVQLSWLTSHPYLYIYPVYFLVSLGLGAQFGLLSLFLDPARLVRLSYVVVLAAVWTLMEWARLFFLSGLSWNPVGLALTGSLYGLQMASLWGVYGLSFWVMLTNLLILRAWITNKREKSISRVAYKPFVLGIGAVLLPYLYGIVHLKVHEKAFAQEEKNGKPLSVLLAQTAFPAEETLQLKEGQSRVQYVFEEWLQILKILKQHQGKRLDMIVLPEFVVPYGTYYPVYPLEAVVGAFRDILGQESLFALPHLQEHLAAEVETPLGRRWMVDNAYWAQAIADVFQAEVVVGLEDVDEDAQGQRTVYNAAFHIYPEGEAPLSGHSFQRYEKRVLVPMGEYLPFKFCQVLAAKYGVCGSFTCGKRAKVFSGSEVPFGVSICYEETYGNLMRENRLLGANLLVNITSDVWYPNSRLPQQHFDHAKLRTVENGIPLIRACNTGVTGAIDSLGRVVDVLGKDAENPEWLSDALLVKLPIYHYRTLYAGVGDGLIIGFCLVVSFLALRFNKFKDYTTFWSI